MIELKIRLEDIDYAGMVGVIFPILQNEAAKSDAPWAKIVQNMRGAPDEKAVRVLLKLLPQSMQDKLAVSLLETYKAEMPAMIADFAKSKGISLSVRDIQIQNL